MTPDQKLRIVAEQTARAIEDVAAEEQRALANPTERQQAKKIAEMWLDFQMNPLTQMVPGDPDCDACVLARQFVRALDEIATHKAASSSAGGSRGND